MLKSQIINKKKYKMVFSGELTVELSILFPIILFTIVSIMDLCFYLHDVVCVRAIAEEYGYVSNSDLYNDDEVMKKMQDDIERTILIAEIKAVNLSSEKNRTSINVDMGMSMFFFNIGKQDKIKVEIVNENNKGFITAAKVVSDICSVN